MADSAFWRDLAEQFRALPVECKVLRADRYPLGDTPDVDHWELNGTSSAKAQVDALARRAALEIPNPPSSDLLTAWLEALIKRGDVRFHSETILSGNNPDGTPRPKQTIGSLYELPQHSANYCKMLESAALQSEFEDKQRNDPRNWSQFRQQYEAFKSIKEVRNQPAEHIPEEFVRNAIARISGIKPEEVTRERIAFEVAGLVPFYHNIKLIPSVPTPESPPVAETKHEYVGIEPTREREKTEPITEPIQDAVPRPVTDSGVDPKALRDSYFANFPDEKIKIRDLCWAAGQHYREWKRWLAGELKDGSTPDLAFRRIVTSGKRPLEFNKRPRPKGWE